MITHTCPVVDEKIFEQMYGNCEDYRAFYCFNGEKYLENGTMKNWIFGHTHKRFTENRFGVNLICNPMGRKKHKKDSTLGAFQLKIT